MMPSTVSHWQKIYKSTRAEDVSWFQPSPRRSMDLIKRLDLPRDCRILDVGGGTSFLVDKLLAGGFQNITVLDIAEESIKAVQARLGKAASRVEWVVADIADFSPTARWDLWHDRAVFHFLVTEEARAAYRSALLEGLAPGGYAVIATFGPEGPDQCSGLPTMRYGADELLRVLDGDLELRASLTEDHITPGGSLQQFLYCLFARPAPEQKAKQ